MGLGLRVLGIVLLALGVVVAVGAVYVKGEIALACSTQQARLGAMLAHPDAEKCRTYPGYAELGTYGGLGIGVLGIVLLALPRR